MAQRNSVKRRRRGHVLIEDDRGLCRIPDEQRAGAGLDEIDDWMNGPGNRTARKPIR